jgi:hypothetical protein
MTQHPMHMNKLTRTTYHSPKHRTASHYVGFILHDLELFMKKVRACFHKHHSICDSYSLLRGTDFMNCSVQATGT